MIKRSKHLLNRIRPIRNCGAATSVLLSLCSSTLASPPKPSLFKDVPQGDPAYKALKQLRKAGIVYYAPVCFPSSRGAAYDAEHPHFTRYEFAVVTQRAVAIVASRKQQAHGKLTAQQTAFQDATNRLAVEFKRELAQLNRK